MTTSERKASGEQRGLMTVLTQLELLAGRLADRAAVHDGINDPSGYHAAAAAAIRDAESQLQSLAERLVSKYGEEGVS